eukprot:CAMPEP_0202827234 /NCGR_PEP_ID=MMETSP1389-20130828/14133_1 /ASSEMBLY_ACC=CAM_ASM_000865 /TAXON_ID=302021 /ORGANISM="Rhodomonas sp., Strain CCMP768" /LENGTH=93 /DNA_ID=CAMNT_0049500609 /DNA_START=53 /DNA_END=331 /DNA_ORIENTATION=+
MESQLPEYTEHETAKQLSLLPSELHPLRKLILCNLFPLCDLFFFSERQLVRRLCSLFRVLLLVVAVLHFDLLPKRVLGQRHNVAGPCSTPRSP